MFVDGEIGTLLTTAGVVKAHQLSTAQTLTSSNAGVPKARRQGKLRQSCYVYVAQGQSSSRCGEVAVSNVDARNLHVPTEPVR